jgi:hypothetical protein
MIHPLILLVVLSLAEAAPGPGDSLQYNRDIRPILSDNCFSCHGPDASRRKAKLRLDVRSGALERGAFVPGKPKQSALFDRVFSDEPDEVMPPPSSQKALTRRQKEMLERWIAEGAQYQAHWAFVPPVKSAPPAPGAQQAGTVIRGPIDRFIQDRLVREGLTSSPEASRETLIRRLTLDLTGLPPIPSEVDAFVADGSSDAYEKVVDRLLSSPRYGERMAVDWLDAARYADSNGYQVDRDRELWPWRDWVIRALNDNRPFDKFTIEQIAGDLLPNATLDQRIATGFHRNHMLNEEGGIIPDEFLAEYTADRVETTATVWLGQTFNCARCHDHKFDPFTQRDFYAMKAFFHNVPERGVGEYGSPIRINAPPFLKLAAPEVEARIATLNKRLKALNEQITALAERSSISMNDLARVFVGEAVKRVPVGNDPTEAERKRLAEARLAQQPEHRRLVEEVESLKKQIGAAEAEVPTTLVMEEMKAPRPTFVLVRGAYDKPGEEVKAATPAVLSGLDDSAPRNRLGLARWLVGPGNPLTARVTVNRFWQQFFGTGLVRTTEDFGSQGEPPSHPELLDWLAVTFRESGWDVKGLVRLIVTSATYRQRSHLTPMVRERDPDNRLLARGPRLRLMAEFVRDQALSASGLLAAKVGGPSVKPYHPPGLYEQVTAGSGYNVYVPGKGNDLYRRSLYTYWKRSVPHPAMLLFDAPFRESCTVRRPRSNTPLQALNLMNDPTYVEAARFLALRMVREGGGTLDSRLIHGFRLLLARQPSPRELDVLRSAFARCQKDFQSDAEAARALLGVGEAKPGDVRDAPELAAFATIASTLLNLDETINKE